MTDPTPTIRVKVDPCNPGEFFACCGLLELADRLWNGAEGWFDTYDREFCMATGGTRIELLASICATPFEQLDLNDDETSPLWLPDPFRMRIDWWRDEVAGGKTFKTWSGQQTVVRITRMMHSALTRLQTFTEAILDYSEAVPDPANARKAVAPFYFDARRAAGARVLDIGFSPDAQDIKTVSYPAVEFLCLVGLQRFRPAADVGRRFKYTTWTKQTPVNPSVAAAIASGGVDVPDTRTYSFRLLFRTKYLKGFLPAIPYEVTDD